MINENYIKLPSAYLFAEIAQRVKAFKAEHPDMYDDYVVIQNRKEYVKVNLK